MKEIDTFIVSDTHLGSRLSNSDHLLEILKDYRFKKLILLGDIFDDLNFNRLTKKDWNFLSYVRKLSSDKKDFEVIWIIGNHDELLIDVMTHLLGVPIYTEYNWEYKNKKYLAMHGHQFDIFILKNKILSHLAKEIYKFILIIEGKRHKFSRMLDRKFTYWRRSSPKIEKGALKYAKLKRADYIFCGHTHMPFESEKDGVNYVNTGCWTDSTLSYVVIDEDGVKTKKVVI
jgi:UDP-2,3-diacylglucosamine pyrophosphatase LpxH